MPVVYIEKDGKNQLPPRVAHDHYPTDQYYADACLASIRDIIADMSPARYPLRYIIDAGAGNDPVFGKAALTYLTNDSRAVARAVELRQDAVPLQGALPANIEWVTGDYLKYHLTIAKDRSAGFAGYDLIVGNPPFILAEEFIHHSLGLLRPGGVLSFLLPITFLGTQGRYESLYSVTPPRRVTFLTHRPSFTGDGQTAPNEYCLLTWVKGDTKVEPPRWLPIPTPPDVRARNLEVRKTRKALKAAQLAEAREARIAADKAALEEALTSYPHTPVEYTHYDQ